MTKTDTIHYRECPELKKEMKEEAKSIGLFGIAALNRHCFKFWKKNKHLDE